MQAFVDFMHGLAARAQALAEALGGPGLAIVAFVDSSFLTLPEVADVLVILLAIRSPADWWYFALMTTAGSLAGSYTLFAIGRKGGEALLRRRFHERHVDRFLAWFRRYGAGVLIIPAMLPPPMPFKLFVLVSGVSGVPRSRFLAAVIIGRGTRYGVEAYLATIYGDAALKLVQTNALNWAGPVVVAIIALAFGFWLWRILRRRALARLDRSGKKTGSVE
jgi:membrane protein YqaA with SNARE-associated domain